MAITGVARVATRVLPDPGPARILALATLIKTAGNGAFISCSALYFTRIVGLSAPQLGIGLTVGGIAGLFAGVPMGHLADRKGQRGTAAVLVVLSGVAMAAYLFVQSFVAFVVVACVYTFFERGGRAALQALVAAQVKGENVVRARAYLRAVNNVGITLGTSAAAIALQIDTGAAYLAVLGVDAVTLFVCAAVLLRLPATISPSMEVSAGPRLAVLRDKPYAAMTAVNMVMFLHFGLPQVALPLWIVRDTSAPQWMVSVLFAINTVSVVLFQVRISKGVSTIEAATKATMRSGVLLFAACAMFAASALGAPVVAAVLLVLAGLIHVHAEMVQSAGAWVLSTDLAPPDKQGQYQGMFWTGYAASVMLTPSLLIFLLVEWGTPGWLVLGGLFVLSGLAMRPVVNWAERARAATNSPNSVAQS